MIGPTSPQRILVVEDEPKLATLITEYLDIAGFATQVIGDGRAAIPAVRAQMPDMILLDLMLPGRDGIEICRELRSFSDVPVIMITARVEEIDRLLGLELGADDYICKPFSPREVVARIRAVLRRTHRETMDGTEGTATDDPLQIDSDSYSACLNGIALDLTPVEFRLLKVMSEAPGRVFSRDRLIDNLYTDHRVVTDRTVDSHVKNLRRKLEQAAPGQDPIRSIYGVGYKLEL
jgi:two-component system response regulator BaeR